MSQASGPLVEITTNASSHEFVRRMLPVSERTGTHFPLKKMERSVCMCTYVCMYIQNPERPREAQRGPERPPERPREAQRGPEKPREAQRGPKRPREAYVHSRTIPGAFPQAELRPELPCDVYVCMCRFQDHYRSIPTSTITTRIALLYVCMYMCMYVCMYVSSYVDDAGELKSCKQSSIRKASKEFRQSNERCRRVALDRSIAKPAFEKFAKNLQKHKFFGPGCWPLAQNP